MIAMDQFPMEHPSPAYAVNFLGRKCATRDYNNGPVDLTGRSFVVIFEIC